MTYYKEISGWMYQVMTWPNGANNYTKLYKVAKPTECACCDGVCGCACHTAS
jgi:hypothetical protein